MPRQLSAAWLGLLVLTSSLAFSGCKLLRDQPLFVEERRPSNVPQAAVYVKGALGGWWQECSETKDGTLSQDHCSIYSWRGDLVYDEIFLPYDGGTPVASGQLTVAHDPALAGPDRIVLANGRILIPQSRFGDVRKFLDDFQASQRH